MDVGYHYDLKINLSTTEVTIISSNQQLQDNIQINGSSVQFVRKKGIKSFRDNTYILFFYM